MTTAKTPIDYSKCKTIKCNPTWLGMLPMMLEIYCCVHKKAHNSRRTAADEKAYNDARIEFKRMAEAADKWNAYCEKVNNELPTTINEAKLFIIECVDYLGLNFDLDADFTKYMSDRDISPMYSEDSAAEANKKLAASKDIFEKAGIDIEEYVISLL